MEEQEQLTRKDSLRIEAFREATAIAYRVNYTNSGFPVNGLYTTPEQPPTIEEVIKAAEKIYKYIVSK